MLSSKNPSVFFWMSILLLIVASSSCKTTRTTQKTTSDNLNIELGKADSIYDKTDSLLTVEKYSPIQDSVSIEVYRLLKDTISIIGVGDIMMGTNYPDNSYLPPNQGKYLLQEVNEILQDADVTFGNLEGVILYEGGDAKNCKNPKL